MSRHRTPTRQVWLRAFFFTAVALLSLPALAAPTCPEVKISGPASLNMPDFTSANGTWTPTTEIINGQPSTPGPSQGGAYQWTQISGPAGTLTNATTPQVRFTAPDVGPAGASVVLQLRVTGCGGTATGTYRINVFDAHDIVVNSPPHALASATPSAATEGTVVTLDGSASYDIDGTPLTYAWTQIGTPSVTLSNANQALASFVAPNLTATTSLTFSLTVSDGTLSNSTTTIVNVVWSNDPPVAALECPLQVNEGAPVTLDGSGSSDGDDGIASYKWEQLVGMPAVPGIETWDTASRTFAAPSLGYLQKGTVPFRLTVTDHNSASSSIECTVFIHDVTAPIISGATDVHAEATSATGANVAFAPTASDAVDGDLSVLLQCLPPSNSLFPFGTTAVGCAVDDSAGNTATAGFNVIVADQTKPLIAAHDDIAVEATGANGAQVDYTPPATSDAVDGAGAATCAPPSGQFALGSTKVYCDAVDGAGNAADQTKFTVTVLDTKPPVLAAHAPIGPVEATGPDGAAVDYTAPTAADIVDGNVAVTCVPPSGHTFAIGATSVGCSATDVHGNTGQSDFLVTVADSTPPQISGVPSDFSIEATSAAGALVTYASPNATDVVDGAVQVNCQAASNTVFALGPHTVECSAEDAHGNPASASFHVDVVDTTAPEISGVSGNLTVEATSAAGALVSYVTPSAHDIVDGTVQVNCEAASNTVFALGPHTVVCSAEDAHGNAASASFHVDVVDTTAPAISGVSGDLGFEATSAAGALVTYASPSATDLVDGAVAVNCAAASNTVFALGPHTVQCSAQDAHGNTASASFHVDVVDTTAPQITGVSPDLTIEATSGAGASVNYGVPAANDVVDGAVSVSCQAPPNSVFALGSHGVTCSAHDSRGNSASVGFNITVRDTTAPTLAGLFNRVIEATSASGAIATYSPSANDAVDSSVAVVCTPPSGTLFALGLHSVSCAASDDSGNTAQGGFTVNVVDTTPPVISSHADVLISGANNSSANVSYTLPTAHDVVSGDVAVTCLPASGAAFAVGATTVHCSASDAAGNGASSSFVVTVQYVWSGFLRPIDNLPTVNVAKAGSAIPVKFTLGGYQGMAIFAAGYPKSAVMSCQGGQLQDLVEETVTAGNSSLQYDAGTQQYIYVWKTDKAWAGACRQLQVKFADGTVHVANFSFTR